MLRRYFPGSGIRTSPPPSLTAEDEQEILSLVHQATATGGGGNGDSRVDGHTNSPQLHGERMGTDSDPGLDEMIITPSTMHAMTDVDEDDWELLSGRDANSTGGTTTISSSPPSSVANDEELSHVSSAHLDAFMKDAAETHASSFVDDDDVQQLAMTKNNNNNTPELALKGDNDNVSVCHSDDVLMAASTASTLEEKDVDAYLEAPLPIGTSTYAQVDSLLTIPTDDDADSTSMVKVEKDGSQTESGSVVCCLAGSNLLDNDIAKNDGEGEGEEFCVLSDKGDGSPSRQSSLLRHVVIGSELVGDTSGLNNDAIDYNIQRFLKSYGTRVDWSDSEKATKDTTNKNEFTDDDEDDLYHAITAVRTLVEEYWHYIVCSTKRASIAIRNTCSTQMYLLPTTCSRIFSRVVYCTYNVKKKLDLSDTSLVIAGLAGAVVGAMMATSALQHRRMILKLHQRDNDIANLMVQVIDLQEMLSRRRRYYHHHHHHHQHFDSVYRSDL